MKSFSNTGKNNSLSTKNPRLEIHSCQFTSEVNTVLFKVKYFHQLSKRLFQSQPPDGISDAFVETT